MIAISTYCLIHNARTPMIELCDDSWALSFMWLIREEQASFSLTYTQRGTAIGIISGPNNTYPAWEYQCSEAEKIDAALSAPEVQHFIGSRFDPPYKPDDNTA